jgi:hypothetical protein
MVDAVLVIAMSEGGKSHGLKRRRVCHKIIGMCRLVINYAIGGRLREVHIAFEDG